jgi:hypothetical protein
VNFSAKALIVLEGEVPGIEEEVGKFTEPFSRKWGKPWFTYAIFLRRVRAWALS